MHVMDIDSKDNYLGVNRYTNYPMIAINNLYKLGVCAPAIKISQKDLLKSNKYTEKVNQEDLVRFVCMSDTHNKAENLAFEVPKGDIFIHAGDFTRGGGHRIDVENFNDWLGSLPHSHKIVIAGNHEDSFDSRSPRNKCCSTKMSKIITNAHYLEDSQIVIDGIKIYGTPWVPFHRGGGFNITRGQGLLDKWTLIPDDTDILITHAPPAGHGDLCISEIRAGCVELLTSVELRIKPKYHIFGHIHEGYGVTTNGETVFINASTCNRNYKPIQQPIVFDFPISEIKSKKLLEVKSKHDEDRMFDIKRRKSNLTLEDQKASTSSTIL